jgi:hypothetical protein
LADLLKNEVLGPRKKEKPAAHRAALHSAMLSAGAGWGERQTRTELAEQLAARRAAGKSMNKATFLPENLQN